MKVLKNSLVSEETEFGKNIEIGYGTIIHSGVFIGNNVKIGAYCEIGHPSKADLQSWDFSLTSKKVEDLIIEPRMTFIGDNSIIRSGTKIYKHVATGINFKTGHNVLIREHTTIGDGVLIGTNAILDGYISVDSKSLIQSNCYVAQSVRIGRGVFIAPNCTFFDNKQIVLGEGALEGAKVKDFVRIGGGSLILPNVTIGKYAFVGAGSVVTKDVPSSTLVFGRPAKKIRELSYVEVENYVHSIGEWE